MLRRLQLLLLAFKLGLETSLSGVIESESVAGQDPEEEGIDSGLGHEAVLGGQVDSEVHDGHRGHAQGTVGRGQGTGDPVIGPQVGQVARGRQHHGAQAALQALGAVRLCLLTVGHWLRLTHVCLKDDLGLRKRWTARNHDRPVGVLG